ncbi:MAG: hypothetical protein K2P43_11605, partial [Lachnospiraceae bacterium]|nr:hypothetical protein [Lachnospiraceae bacterium]
GIITLLGLFSRTVCPIHSWGSLILTGAVMGPLSLMVNFFIILRREERKTVIQMIRSRVKGAA